MKRMSLFTLALLFSASVFAKQKITYWKGASDGGGGKGVICYNNDGSIKSARLLDFYEGEVLDGLQFKLVPGNFRTIFAKKVRERLEATNLVTNLPEEGLKISKGFRFLKPGTRLNPIPDSGEIFIPAGCKVEQLANFQGLTRIYIVTDFWKHLPDLDKAGLVLHELLWYVDRMAGFKKSHRARRDTARIFSENYQFKKANFKPRKGDLICYNQNPVHQTSHDTIGNFFYIRKTPPGFIAQFLFLNRGFIFEEHKMVVEKFYPEEVTTYDDLFKFFAQYRRPEYAENERSDVRYDDINMLDIGLPTHYFHLRQVYKVSPRGVQDTIRFELKVTNNEFVGYDEKEFTALSCFNYTEETEEETSDLLKLKRLL